MNDAMSAGVHRLWKDEFVRMISPQSTKDRLRILDVAGGTGDIAFRLADALKQNGIMQKNNDKEEEDIADITVCDINTSMLQVGQERARGRGYHENVRPKLEWITGDAEALEVFFTVIIKKLKNMFHAE